MSDAIAARRDLTPDQLHAANERLKARQAREGTAIPIGRGRPRRPSTAPTLFDATRALKDHCHGTAIPEGVRHITLVSIAGRVRWEGADDATLRHVLERVNHARCVPPVPTSEVDRIAKSMRRYPIGDGGGAVSRAQFEQAQERLIPIGMAMLSARWPGRAGATDYALLHALVGVAWASGRVTIRCATRRAADLIGVSKRTATASLIRLRRRGWLTKIARAPRRPTLSTGQRQKINQIKDKAGTQIGTLRRYRATGVYRLRVPIRVQRQLLHNCPNMTSPTEGGFIGVVTQQRDAGHDAWRTTGLGKSARRVLLALRTTPHRAADLSRILQLHRATVGRSLAKLAAYELAAQTGAGWVRGDGGDLDAAARDRGTWGKGEAQRDAHDAERAEYDRALVCKLDERKWAKLYKLIATCPPYAMAAAPPIALKQAARWVRRQQRRLRLPHDRQSRPDPYLGMSQKAGAAGAS